MEKHSLASNMTTTATAVATQKIQTHLGHTEPGSFGERTQTRQIMMTWPYRSDSDVTRLKRTNHGKKHSYHLHNEPTMMSLRAIQLSPAARVATVVRTSLVTKRSYHEKIVEHYENPQNVGSLDKNDESVGTVRAGRCSCGLWGGIADSFLIRSSFSSLDAFPNHSCPLLLGFGWSASLWRCHEVANQS
jgi:NifU-like N terminal domain